MTVQDEMAHSARLMRLALPEMARHGCAMDPLNYTVWYTHVSGRIPALSEELRAYLAAQDRLSRQQVQSLFDRYINDQEVEAIERMRQDLADVVDDVARNTNSSRAQAHAYEESLQAYVEQFQDDASLDHFSETLQALLGETAAMRSQVDTFGQHLSTTADEVERLREALAVAREESIRDALTGLANRRGFDIALRTALDADPGRSDRGCCLLLLDIDFFKRINDSYGHPLGDRVIASVARVLARMLEPGQTAARYGGEEFAVILPDATRGQARALAERLRADVARGRIKQRNGKAIAQVTVSVGVCVPPVRRTPDTYLETADRALYQSKREGRNRVSILPASAQASGNESEAATERRTA
ncbi:GGDEF domain-containing protein [Algiphilus sp.]|uniref:GGDEF domain-containing protein n=1 Tax=Algiphilus sp. TaxID=1872431 RepID=UPI003B52A10B